eukprot:639701-Prymnesium_polylepis.1
MAHGRPEDAPSGGKQSEHLRHRAAGANMMSSPCHRARTRLPFLRAKGWMAGGACGWAGRGFDRGAARRRMSAAVRPTTACSGSPRVHCR